MSLTDSDRNVDIPDSAMTRFGHLFLSWMLVLYDRESLPRNKLLRRMDYAASRYGAMVMLWFAVPFAAVMLATSQPGVGRDVPWWLIALVVAFAVVGWRFASRCTMLLEHETDSLWQRVHAIRGHYRNPRLRAFGLAMLSFLGPFVLAALVFAGIIATGLT